MPPPGPPPAVPPGWMVDWSDQYNQWFYNHPSTGASQWHHPSEDKLPPAGPQPYAYDTAQQQPPQQYPPQYGQQPPQQQYTPQYGQQPPQQQYAPQYDQQPPQQQYAPQYDQQPPPQQYPQQYGQQPPDQQQFAPPPTTGQPAQAGGGIMGKLSNMDPKAQTALALGGGLLAGALLDHEVSEFSHHHHPGLGTMAGLLGAAGAGAVGAKMLGLFGGKQQQTTAPPAAQQTTSPQAPQAYPGAQQYPPAPSSPPAAASYPPAPGYPPAYPPAAAESYPAAPGYPTPQPLSPPTPAYSTPQPLSPPTPAYPTPQQFSGGPPYLAAAGTGPRPPPGPPPPGVLATSGPRPPPGPPPPAALANTPRPPPGPPPPATLANTDPRPPRGPPLPAALTITDPRPPPGSPHPGTPADSSPRPPRGPPPADVLTAWSPPPPRRAQTSTTYHHSSDPKHLNILAATYADRDVTAQVRALVTPDQVLKIEGKKMNDEFGDPWPECNRKMFNVIYQYGDRPWEGLLSTSTEDAEISHQPLTNSRMNLIHNDHGRIICLFWAVSDVWTPERATQLETQGNLDCAFGDGFWGGGNIPKNLICYYMTDDGQIAMGHGRWGGTLRLPWDPLSKWN